MTFLFCLLCLLVPGAALAQADSGSALASDGPSYPVSELVIEYIDPNPQFPSPEEMAATEVEVSRVAEGLVAPRAGLPSETLRISGLGAAGTQQLYASAIRAINQQLVFEFNQHDFHAIVVSPLPDDIERRTGRDLRPPGVTRLRLGVYAGRVRDLRTFASGDAHRDSDDKLDLPQHAWIREGSPIQPGTPQDLVRKDELDDYLARLNRHPARRVDAELSPARTAGGVNLDYMVAESKPWWAYVQYENTGTEETTKNRERFGFVHSQLLGRDDILQLDYITGDFDQVNATIGSYEFPFQRGGRLRGRVFGFWSDYDASVLGFSGDPFTGKEGGAGGQLIANVFQWEGLFLDALVGGQWNRVKVTNDLAGTEGKDNFALGMLGLRTQRLGLTSSLSGEVTVLRNFASLAGTEADELDLLGRLGVDQDDFSVLRWDTDLSFFVEPLLSPRSWRDPAALATKTLAHEIALSFQGQNGLGNRLIPQQELVAGGLYTVRGYPEAAAVGDNLEIASVEYRLHLPRLLAPSASAKPVLLPVVGEFRTRPQYEYTFPDWDLILRAFFDAAHVDQVHQDAFEDSSTLLGTGVGLELRLKQYLSARVDWGFALRDLDANQGEPVDSGDDKWNVSVTLLY